MTHPEKTKRNAEVLAAFAAGQTVSQVAGAFGICRSRARAIMALWMRRSRVVK